MKLLPYFQLNNKWIKRKNRSFYLVLITPAFVKISGELIMDTEIRLLK